MAIINPEWIIKQEGSFQTAEEMNVLASAVKNNAVELQTDVNNLSAHVNNKANPHEVTKIQLDLENVDNVSDANKPVSIAQAAAIAAIQADFDSHEADKANPHQVTKTQIGLSEADNTSDINKPVSTAQQIILDNKINLNGLNSNIDKLHFNPTTLTQLSSIGDVRYSLESKTIEVKVSDTVSIQLGQEMQTVVKNDAGVQINNGQLVYVNSAIDTNALAKIASTTDADISQRTFGMATENIATNEFGSITTEGLVRGLNTVAFSEGTMLYLGVNGAFTGTEPTAPTSKISVGMVIRSHETEGVVYVKIRAIARNQKLSDVYAPIMTNGDILRWNNSTLRFETFNITSALNTKENISNKGIVNGYASLDNSGKIPVTQLPSYVDDVLEYASLIDFPVVGESNKIYIALDTNKTYRWSGSTYVYITSGAVDSVAGKTGIVTLDKTDVGLPNADNTSDINKPISTATQTALNLKTNQTRSIISGSGLTGGGDLSTDRTLNVSSANDGITVNVDNIQLNAVNNVTSTSITQPLAANQGKILNDNLTQLGANLSTSVADEKAMFPAIAYNKRVLADGGTVISKQSVIDGYKTMIDLLPNTKLLFCPQAGVKTRVSGIYSYLSKAYDMGVNGIDLTQTTEANQPYLSGNISPNEKRNLKVNINTPFKILFHNSIPFVSTDSFSILLIIKPNRIGSGQSISFPSSYISFTSTSTLLYGNSATLLNCSSILDIGKINIVEFKYSNGVGLIKINGKPVSTTSSLGAITLSQIVTNSNTFDGNIYHYQVFDKYLSESESNNIFNYLRSQYPEIEGVNIGNQHWATSNYEGVVTGNGTVIPEVQSASTASNPELVPIASSTFDTDGTVWWGKVRSTFIWNSGGFATFTATETDSYLYKDNLGLIPSKMYYIKFLARSSQITKKLSIGGDVTSTINPNLSIDWQNYEFLYKATTSSFYNIKIANGSINDTFDIDNISIKEVGWADLTTPAWCYYNNDPVLGSVYGKLYNYYAVQEIAKNPPKGWRVPSSADFVQLSTYLGGNTVSGGKLKKEGLVYWGSPNTGATNESGFSGLPAGFRRYDTGVFSNLMSRKYVYLSDTNNGFILRNDMASTERVSSNFPLNDKSGLSLRLIRTSPVGDQVQNISTGVFTTNITGGVYKDLQIPFGYQVDAIILNAATNITNFKCDLYNYGGGTLQGNILTGKTATANVPIKYSVLADIPVQYQDPILRFSCTKTDTTANIEIQIVIYKIL